MHIDRLSHVFRSADVYMIGIFNWVTYLLTSINALKAIAKGFYDSGLACVLSVSMACVPFLNMRGHFSRKFCP